MIVLTIILYLLGVMVAAATVLPLWRTSRWWVRLCDFPRFQIAVLAGAVFALVLLTSRPLDGPAIGLLCVMAVCGFWQLSWIWRYIPFAPLEVDRDESGPEALQRIALLTTNVFQPARDADDLSAIISAADPDLVLAVETDEWWCSRLQDGLAARYSHHLVFPLSNGYGMALFSRLELIRPSIRFLVDDAIPSVKSGVRLRSGAVVDLYGVHPRPPAPQQDSAERDAELALIATEIKRSRRPAIVLGDLNDVAWSPTTCHFKHIGGLLDPRRGRGFFSTYPAGLPGLRYPLDYVFHTPHFRVSGMRVLPRTQSDHLPLITTLCIPAHA